MTGDDDGTCPGLFTLIDEISFGETLSFVCFLELLSKLVVAYATGVDHGVWREHVLGERRFRNESGEGECETYRCTTSSVLCGTTCDVDDLVFLDDLVITFFWEGID